MRAIIFDLDGTLIDLFEEHLKAFQNVIKNNFNLNFTREDLKEYYGLPSNEILSRFFSKNNIKVTDYKYLIDEKRKEFKKLVSERVNVLPGAIELLNSAKSKNIKLGLATGNDNTTTEIIIKSARLDKYFDVIVTRDDVKKGKPNPDIFLKVAEKLNVNPKECIAIEDSIYGIESGKNAGMFTIAVLTGTQSYEEILEKKPDLIVNTLKELDFGDLLE